MPDSYKEFIVDEFNKRKKQGSLSPILQDLTPGNIRLECLKVYRARYQDSDEAVLRLFFEWSEAEQSFYPSIENSLADKYRQIPKILRDEIPSPGIRYLELIAWLLDIQPRPQTKWIQGSSMENPEKRWFKERTRVVLILLGLLVVVWIGYSISQANNNVNSIQHFLTSSGSGYMYWKNDHFEPISKEIDIGDTLKLAMDEYRLKHFRKVLQKDTITFASIGKLWYLRINNDAEFFTGPGYHPVHVDRKLKRASRTIIENYAR